MENEIWKDVIGYEGLYLISNIGNVRSLDLIYQRGNTNNYHKKGKILTKNFDGNYYSVCLYKEKKGKTIRIHQLVAIHFVDNTNNEKNVNHKDGDKLNNHFSNLEWCNHRENINHSFKIKNENKICGVFLDKKSKKFRSQITIKGKQLHLGTFESDVEAKEARIKYEKENSIINKYSK